MSPAKLPHMGRTVNGESSRIVVTMLPAGWLPSPFRCPEPAATHFDQTRQRGGNRIREGAGARWTDARTAH